MAGWSADTLDLVLLATSTPDDLFGSAPRVQAALGARNAVAFDLTAACSGFLFALVTASQYLRTGAMRRVLVIGADQLSRFVDWDDRRSCVLFGDGAGALAMEASEEDGLQGFLLRSDGARGGVLNLPALDTGAPLAGQAEHRQGGYRPIAMNGQEVYKFAVREVPPSCNRCWTNAISALMRSTGCCCTRPISAFWMPWPIASRFLTTRCSATWPITATHQRPPFPWSWMKVCAEDAFARATCLRAVGLAQD